MQSVVLLCLLSCVKRQTGREDPVLAQRELGTNGQVPCTVCTQTQWEKVICEMLQMWIFLGVKHKTRMLSLNQPPDKMAKEKKKYFVAAGNT